MDIDLDIYACFYTYISNSISISLSIYNNVDMFIGGIGPFSGAGRGAGSVVLLAEAHAQRAPLPPRRPSKSKSRSCPWRFSGLAANTSASALRSILHSADPRIPLRTVTHTATCPHVQAAPKYTSFMPANRLRQICYRSTPPASEPQRSRARVEPVLHTGARNGGLRSASI